MILVTGASGFVGRHVVRELARDGMRVRAMVRTARGAAALEGIDCELFRGDVTDPALLHAAARGVRTIVHLVAIIEGSPATFERVMAAGTGNLVEAARESGVRRVVLMSALGTGPGATVPYFRAKWAAEQAVASSGVDHAVLRPSFVFGTDGGALPRFLRIARLAPVTPVIGPGTQRVQPIWVDDLVRAVRLAVEAEGTATPIELGGPEAVTWSELWRRIKTALGTRRPAMHVPFWLARGPAALFERMPPALLTRDQLRMLEGPDNVVADGGASMRRLGLGELVALDEQLPARAKMLKGAAAAESTSCDRVSGRLQGSAPPMAGISEGSALRFLLASRGDAEAPLSAESTWLRPRQRAPSGICPAVWRGSSRRGPLLRIPLREQERCRGPPSGGPGIAVLSVGFGRGASCLTEVVGGARARVPYAWLWRFPVGPGDTPLPAGTSTAGTTRI